MGKEKASDLLLQSALPFDKACMIVREMEDELDRLTARHKKLSQALQWLGQRSRCSAFKVQADTSNTCAVRGNHTLHLDVNSSPLYYPAEWIGCKVHRSDDPEEWCMSCRARQALLDDGQTIQA